MANGISSVQADSFTLAGTNYREIFTAHDISASAVSITFGDLSDAISVSSLVLRRLLLLGAMEPTSVRRSLNLISVPLT